MFCLVLKVYVVFLDLNVRDHSYHIIVVVVVVVVAAAAAAVVISIIIIIAIQYPFH
jgi:hypothetical protein